MGRFEFTDKMKFCHINDLDEAFICVFDSSFLAHICKKNTGPIGILGNFYNGFVFDGLFNDWYNDLVKSFAIRHKVVHDANFRAEIDIQFIQRVESIFLVIPQLAAHFIAKKFNLNRFLFKNENTCAPYIFTPSEFLAKDWYCYD